MLGKLGSIPRLGRRPGEGNGNLLQYSWLENPMDGEAWWATVHGVTKSRTGLSDFTLILAFSWVSCNEVLDSTTPKEIFSFMIDTDF